MSSGGLKGWERVLDSPGAGITGGCELPEMGVGS